MSVVFAFGSTPLLRQGEPVLEITSGTQTVQAVQSMVSDHWMTLASVKCYETAFHRATGFHFTVAPVTAVPAEWERFSHACAFCQLVIRTRSGCLACRAARERLLQRVRVAPVAQSNVCFASFTEFLVPIVLGERPIAVIWSGHVLKHPPTEKNFTRLLETIGPDLNPAQRRALARAYFSAPVVAPARLHAIAILLEAIARNLQQLLDSEPAVANDFGPAMIIRAQRFIDEHVCESISLSQVARHVHASRSYFCRLFKKTAGLTLTQWVTRARLKKACALLTSTNLRITDVVEQAGFGSIPQFNAVFKRYTGMPPTAYRKTHPDVLRARSV